MKAVYLAAGENPALMRLPNLVFALLAIALVYLVCSREFGRAPAFAAALLFSLHPAMVLFSVSGRGYAGMIFFTLISSILFLQLLRSFSWWRCLGCATAGFLAGTSHLFAVNALIAQVLLVLVVVSSPEQSAKETIAERAVRMGPAILGPVVALALLAALYLPQLRLSATEGFQLSLSDSVSPRSRQLHGRLSLQHRSRWTSRCCWSALALIGLVGLRADRTLKVFLGLLFLCPDRPLWAVVLRSGLHPASQVFCLSSPLLLPARGRRDGARGSGRLVRQSRAIVAVQLCIVVRAAVWLGVVLDRRRLCQPNRRPGGNAFVRAQAAVGDFIETRHPEAHFLTNDPGFVRVRLRQERNMDRILPALGIKPIRAFQAEEPAGEIYFIYVPKKRLTEADLIHYQGEGPTRGAVPEGRQPSDVPDEECNPRTRSRADGADLSVGFLAIDVRALAGARWERSQAPVPRIRIAAACRYASPIAACPDWRDSSDELRLFRVGRRDVSLTLEEAAALRAPLRPA